MQRRASPRYGAVMAAASIDLALLGDAACPQPRELAVRRVARVAEAVRREQREQPRPGVHALAPRDLLLRDDLAAPSGLAAQKRTYKQGRTKKAAMIMFMMAFVWLTTERKRKLSPALRVAMLFL